MKNLKFDNLSLRNHKSESQNGSMLLESVSAVVLILVISGAIFSGLLSLFPVKVKSENHLRWISGLLSAEYTFRSVFLENDFSYWYSFENELNDISVLTGLDKQNITFLNARDGKSLILTYKVQGLHSQVTFVQRVPVLLSGVFEK